MPNISWDETVPSDGEAASLGDDRIRSLKSSIRVGLGGEHVWPAAGGDAGVHLLGSGRPFVGAQSLVSSTGTDGRLYWTSDTSRFFHVGSGGTAFIGGAAVISAGSYPGGAAPQRYYWAMEFGNGTTAASGVTLVTIPNSGYSGAPFVQVTRTDVAGASSRGATMVPARTQTQFEVDTYDTGGAAVGGIGFTWLSIGSRVL